MMTTSHDEDHDVANPELFSVLVDHRHTSRERALV